jgi:crotonobetainyl-CoA:carnitine CoA-transferase CaiB-like acyl-CoA transferase
MRTGEIRHEERTAWGKPLDGVRVLALEQMQALPYATQLMAHLGAEVVKVEHPVHGESGRGANPRITDADGRSVGATYLRNNLCKRSIGIDLKQPSGAALIRRLVPHFDIVAENFKPGTMERLGLDYAAIAKLDPRAIYLSISGFGHLTESPYGSWPAYAPIVEAMAGLYEPNRKPGEPPPVVVAGALGDNASALFAVIGALSALRQRERTGSGQHVDVSMFDSMIAMTDMVPQLWSLGAPASMAAPGTTAIVGGFRASDGYFVVSVFREHHFQLLAELVGHPEWVGDPRFATREDWARQTESLIRPAIEAWARDKTKLEAARAFAERGVAAGPSNIAEDLAADEHVAARDMLIEVPRSDAADPMLVVGNPVKMSHAAEGPITSFPGLGQHTAEVLSETLGLEAPELEALRSNGVIGLA